MGRLLKNILDFYLYTNFHIALGASLSVISAYAILVHIPDSNYPILVFFGTLLIYCIHRLVGLEKLKESPTTGRFQVIKKYRIFLYITGGLSSVVCLYFFLRINYHIQLLLILPIVISILYILPVFKEKKRLRDFQFIKIFLISLVWAFLIGIIPFYEAKGYIDWKGVVFSLELFFFIFAITIPFDIRDLAIDRELDVTTIPELIGIKNSYVLSYGLLILAVITGILLYFMNIFSARIGIALLISYIFTTLFIELTKRKKSDYLFTGLLDGSIILRALLGIVFSGILSVIF